MILETEEGGKKKKERDINVREKYSLAAACTCHDQGLNPRPRYVPDQGLNPHPFGVQDDTPTNWATWPG